MIKTKNKPYKETIVAQCTPSGAGALALIRLSGPEALAIATSCSLLSSGKTLTDVVTHTIHHGWVTQGKEKIDEVLFLVMHAPRTFTGETTVEITCHNNPFIIDAIIQRSLAAGARPAQPGEFSRLAVENNKIDLLQAEAINELIHAQSQQALRQALGQLEGTLSFQIEQLEKDLLHLLVVCEASFEFLEEDVDFSASLQEQCTALSKKTATLLAQFDHQTILREGVRIALLGTVNAGKSSLFNALVGKNRAIVTPIAGTTRDVIESGAYLFGTYITFVDTAGLRKTKDLVEQEGIERSYQEAERADIILLVYDGSRATTEQEAIIYKTILARHGAKTITVINKTDLPQQAFPLPATTTVALSAEKQEGITTLSSLLEQRIQELFTKAECPFLLSQRQIKLLTTFSEQLTLLRTLLFANPIEYELVAYHLKDALALLSELTGKSVSEKMLDQVFKSFCVGK